MKRVVRNFAAIVFLLVLSMTLSACSAGQVTQTATQDRDLTGGFGHVGDITIRAVQLAYPPNGVYRPGDQIPVSMAIVNSGRVDDQLIGIAGKAFSGATVTSSPAAPSASVGTPSATPEPPPTTARSVLSTPDADRAEPTAVNIPIPADQAVFIGPTGPIVMLTGLTRPVDAAQSLQLTLTFARAGETRVTAIMGPPPAGPATQPRHRVLAEGATENAGAQ